MNLAEDMRTYLRGMGIRAAADIPCVATSNTEAQAGTIIMKNRMWSAILILIFGAAILLPGHSRHLSAGDWLWRAVFFAGLVAVILLAGRYLGTDLRNYRDPRIRIEIGPGDVVISGPAGRDVRPYATLVSLMVISNPGSRSPSFRGIGFDTKIGYIELTNDYFQPGLQAAGAILKRMDELGVQLTPYP